MELTLASLLESAFGTIDLTMCGTARNPGIERVIENGIATVVLFEDGTKAVVKCARCAGRDPEKAVLHAMLKRVWPGYLDELRKAVPDGE